MPKPVFVGREAELGRLNSFLALADAGKSQVVFITGEAGAGKSSLVAEFIQRAEDVDGKLIASIGECNAQTGMTDPYLPFRQVLTALTSENQPGSTSDEAQKQKKLGHWKEFVQISTKTLIMLGPDLVGIFVPGGSFITRIGTTIALNSNVATRLSELVGKKPAKQAPQINPTLDQEKIFEQYTQVLQALAKDRTLVIVLDDLQWADSGSINLLFHLARQVKDSRLLLVGTYRPDDLALGRDGNRHPLETVLNELKRYYGDITIDLSRSQANEETAFVNALVDAEPNHLDGNFRDELFTHTGGQPLFTVELLRALQERGSIIKDNDGSWVQQGTLDWNALPARVDGVIGERIARLPADLHETLSVASVIGEDFAAQVVAAIQKMDERQVIRNLSWELEKRYLLVREQGELKIGKTFLSQYQFTHLLVQQYLADQLSSGEQRLLHGEIAQVLEQVYNDRAGEIALQLAHHYQLAGIEDKAVGYLSIAGDGSYRAYAYTEAINAYSRALELVVDSSTPGDLLTHIYLNRGRALELNNQYPPALQNYNDMLVTAQARKDRRMELAAKVAASTLYSTPTPLSDAAKAQTLCEETLSLSRELEDRASEARVLWNMQLLNLLHNNADQAIEYGEQSLAICNELDLQEQKAYVLSDLGWAYNVACQFDKAEQRLVEGASLWRELDNLPMLSNNLNTSLYHYYWTGNNEKVLSVSQEAYQLSSSIHETWNQASARNFQGRVWMDYGEVDRAIDAFEDSIRLTGQGNPIYEVWYYALLAQAYAELGAVERSTEIYQAHCIQAGDLPQAPYRTSTLVAYALIELANGKLEEAASALEECTPDAPPWECLLLMAKCQLALASKDSTGAGNLARSAVDLAAARSLGRYLPEALLLKSKAELLRGDASSAKSTLEQALLETQKLGSRRFLWQILTSLAGLEPDGQVSSQYRSQGQQIVAFIAEHISPVDLKQSFLRMAAVDPK